MTATLRDVAKRAKVSVKTASRVLNDEASVADATRAKVLKAIRDLGYVANLSARRLATGSAFTIGLVFQNASWHYILDVQRAVLETARPAGYHMILQPFDAASDVDADTLTWSIASQGAHGTASASGKPSRIDAVVWHKMPLFLSTNSTGRPNIVSGPKTSTPTR